MEYTKVKPHVLRARETVSMYGLMGSDLQGIELQDLIAVLLDKYATPMICGELASLGVRQLVDLSLQEIMAYGLPERKALEVQTAFLLSKKLMAIGHTQQRVKLNSHEKAAAFMMDELSGLSTEQFCVAYLDVKNQVIAKKHFFSGGYSSAVVEVGPLLKEAFKHGASSMILYHNHPSGDAEPSPDDVRLTEKIADAAEVVGITVVDHIVIGHGNYVSLLNDGHIRRRNG